MISFIMKIENLDYVEAVKFLAQRAGMELPDSGYDDSMSKLRRRVFEANREAARFYYATLISPKGAKGLEYFRSRCLSDKTIRRFGLGFADDDWSSLCNHLKQKGFSENEIVAANLGVKRRNGNGIYDRFTNRVIFPIIDVRGNVIAFGGRIMTDEKPKYLNTSDTPVFKKSANLFSLNNAKSSGSRTLILCEGYMDVIAVNQAGFQNAVATLGTALTVEQALLMKRYADEVIICYDADEAGQKATARAIPILRNAGLDIRVLTVPNGKDPDEFIRSHGADGATAFKLLIDKSGNDIEYRLNKLKSKYNVELADGKVSFLKDASKVIATISSPIERDVYISKLSSELSVDKNAIVKQVNSIARRNGKEEYKKEITNIQKNLSRQTDKIDTEHHKKPRSSSAEESLVVFLINNPDYAKIISDAVSPDKFQNTLMRRYYTYVLDRINNGLDPLTNIAADFTSDEASYLYRIMSRSVKSASTESAMYEYINVINEESQKLSNKDIADMSSEQINDYLKKIRKNKQ